MAKYGKWIAGGLGWAVFGPIGGLLGFALGSLFEADGINTQNRRTTSGDFAMSLLVLVAAVMKADGKVMKSELDFVKTFFIRNFGQQKASEAIMMLKDMLDKEIPVQEVSAQIKISLDYSSRLQLLHLLYGISAADGKFAKAELDMIETISRYLGISEKDRLSIHSMFVGDTDASYKILEIEKSASDEDVKKAYRKMAVKYHPDKVNHLGDDFKKTAEEKFKKVNEAYEKIKKERGIN